MITIKFLKIELIKQEQNNYQEDKKREDYYKSKDESAIRRQELEAEKAEEMKKKLEK